MATRTPSKLRPAAPLLFFNRATRPFREQLVNFDAASLRTWAERTTGLRDWGADDGFFHRLDENIEALDGVAIESGALLYVEDETGAPRWAAGERALAAGIELLVEDELAAFGRLAQRYGRRFGQPRHAR